MKTGGAAFSRAAFSSEEFEDAGANGMALLDYFAAYALQGIIVSQPEERRDFLVAESAYNYANAMLAEREKRGVK